MDSFIIGALSALIISLVVVGWKFFHIKNPNDKQLIVRIVIGICIDLFNIVAILMLIFNVAILEESFSIMFFGILTFIIPIVIASRLLYKDIIEMIQRKKQNQNKSKDIN